VDVLILHDLLEPGARADELDVLAQAASVEQALAELGHESRRLACNLDLESLRTTLLAERPDVVFNLVESPGRKGAWIHLPLALVEGLGLPVTGCDATAMLLTSNKLECKRLLRLGGLPTPDWHDLGSLEGVGAGGAGGAAGGVGGAAARSAPSGAAARGGSAEAPLTGAWILKSVWEHGSVGLDEDSVVRPPHARALHELLTARTPALAGHGFAEAYVDGREFNLALLVEGRGARVDGRGALVDGRGARVLPPAEIVFEGYAPGRARVVGYRAKWVDDSFEATHTPRRFDFEPDNAPLLARLSDLALATWELFHLAGHVRVDFRVDAQGQPFVIDVNTNPCLSPDAGFAAGVARAGMTMTEVVARLLEDALQRRPLLGVRRPVAR